MLQPDKWTILRKDALPIVEIIGESVSAKNESYMIFFAVKLITLAEEFKGILISEEPKFFKKSEIEVGFSVVFPNEESIIQFVEEVKKRLSRNNNY
ncbi:MAG: hypothetical protein ACI4UE_05440 [Candidatus Scatovivens sp.]